MNSEISKYSTWYMKRCDKDKTPIDKKFVKWMNSVEQKVKDTLHYNLLDLPDEPYFVSFENGASADDMAQHVINANLYLVVNNAVDINARVTTY
jgi:hypothetical protein